MRTAGLLLYLCLAAFLLTAQETFLKIYSESGIQEGISAIETPDAGFIFYSPTKANQNWDSTLITRVDRFGNLIWSRKFGKTDKCYFDRSICIISDSLFVFPTIYGDTTCLVFINLDGDSIYSVFFPKVHIGSVTKSSDACLLISAVSVIPVKYGELRIYKTTMEGERVWTGIFKFPYSVHAISAIESGDKEVFFLGRGTSMYFFNWPLLIKTSSDGDSLWCREIIESYYWDVSCYSMDVSKDNTCIMAGFSLNEGNAFLAKTDASGNLLWYKNYETKHYFKSVRSLFDGGYVLTGKYRDTDSSFFVFRINSAGDSLWERSYQAEGYIAGNSITICNDGGLLVCGSMSDSLEKSFLLRTDSLGRIINPGIKEPSDGVITRFFPNPTCDNLNIDFQIEQSDLSTEVYDLSGQLVKTVIEKGNARNIIISLTSLVPAAYVVRVLSGPTQIARCIIQKQ